VAKANLEQRLDAANRIHSAAIHLLRRVRAEDAASELTPARLSALSVVVFAGPLSLGELAAAEDVRPPTMTRIVDALQEAGLVEKLPAGDRRSISVAATAAGRQLLDEARERRLRTLAELLGGLDRAEAQTIAAAADLIEQVLGGRRHPLPPLPTRRG
jgi:DNA-binding MarR family transcriptional regulator